MTPDAETISAKQIEIMQATGNATTLYAAGRDLVWPHARIQTAIMDGAHDHIPGWKIDKGASTRRQLTANDIERCGALLCGRKWPAELADLMGASLSTIKNWRKGRSMPHPSRTHAMKALLTARRDAIDAALKALE